MKNRVARVRELLQRELGSMLARDHAFPDVLVTVNDVEITQDLKNARVFIGVVGPEHRQQAVVDRLNKERGDLQYRVSRRVVLKHTPQLLFKLDHSVERGVRVTRIMEEIDRQLAESALLNPDPAPEEESKPEAGAPAPPEAAPASAGDTPEREKPNVSAAEEDDADDGDGDAPARRKRR